MTRPHRWTTLTAMGAAACLALTIRAGVGPASQDFPGSSQEVAERLSDAFHAAARDVRGSVVRIRVIQRFEPVPEDSRLPDLFGESPFRRFFGDDLLEPFSLPRAPYFQEGQGSGFVVGADGYILTNHHVVRGADEVEVQFPDGRTMRATIAGTDSRTDVAVVQVEAEDLEPLRLGDSDQIQVGQWVLAVGNPFGLSSTITAGIVSATGRSNVGLAAYEDFIQTDAAINPGNSGGPLVNLRGEVVGMSTAIATRSGGFMGIGFAIPSNRMASILDELIATGSVTRGLLGVLIQDLDGDLAGSFGFEGTSGALVSEVAPGGPAARAGMQPGDIVVRFDGEEVLRSDQLRERVARAAPGSVVAVEVFREGAVLALEVEIGRMTEELAHADARQGGDARALGVEVRTLTPESAQRLGLQEGTRGAVVTRVDPLSPAERAGLRPGDVITSIGDRRVETAADFREVLSHRDLAVGLRMTVRSSRGSRFVFLRVEDPG